MDHEAQTSGRAQDTDLFWHQKSCFLRTLHTEKAETGESWTNFRQSFVTNVSFLTMITRSKHADLKYLVNITDVKRQNSYCPKLVLGKALHRINQVGPTGKVVAMLTNRLPPNLIEYILDLYPNQSHEDKISEKYMYSLSFKELAHEEEEHGDYLQQAMCMRLIALP